MYLMFCLVLGDILIFMPGQEDIEVTCELIAGMFVIMCICHTCVSLFFCRTLSCFS